VTYQQFLKVFADKAAGKSSTEQVRTEIKVLLKDEPDLIEGFETFLPVKDQNKVDDGSAELAGGTVQ
jgi:histone deacetylase complex regulatory component SIN3